MQFAENKDRITYGNCVQVLCRRKYHIRSAQI